MNWYWHNIIILFHFIFHVAFNMIDGTHATLQRGVYVISNLLAVALAVYKCQVMGLLPTHPSDWLAFVEPQTVSTNELWNVTLNFDCCFLVNVNVHIIYIDQID